MQGLKPEELDGLTALSMKLEKGDWYDLLGLEAEFEPSELKRAYYDLSRQYHPDRFYRRNIEGHEELIEGVFAGINKAYNTLRDSTARRRYDEAYQKKSGGVRRPRRKKKPPEQKAPATDDEVVMDIGRKRGEPSTPSTSSTSEKRAQRAARRTKAAPKKPIPPHILKLRRQIAQRLAKARKYYQAAMKEIEDEQWVKAASSLYLSCQYDPKNEEYKRLHAETAGRANESRVAQFMAEAANAESYRNTKQAIFSYEKAIEYDPPKGTAWFNLGQILLQFEDDDRGALSHFRRAVEKEPSNIKYRMALAEQYVKLNMNRNAKREYQAILQREPKNEDAKAGLKKVRFA